MRRSPFLAALAAALALAGCTLKTPEGAACDDIGGIGQCPEGQRCGADGTCSVAAVACEQPICTAATCSGQTLNRCVQSGACASLVAETCTEHQTCNENPGSCDCIASACDGSKGSFCDAGGSLVACRTEAVSGCHFEASPVGCGAFRECRVKAGDSTNSECACKPDPVGCVAVGTQCSSDGKAIVTCDGDGVCFIGSVAPCPTGEVCGASGAPACTCPASDLIPAAGGGCPTESILACNGTTLLKCVPVDGSPSCKEWREESSCAGSGLACGINPSSGTAACICPQREAGVLYADSSVDPQVTGLAPTGALTQNCRFPTLKDALAAAIPLDTVKAVGTGPVLEFREAPLVVPSDVTLVGDESPSVDPTKVVIEIQAPTAPGVSSAGVGVEASGGVRGLTIRRGTGAEATVGVEVKGASPTGKPSLADVRVDAGGPGGAFITGIQVGGAGPVGIDRASVLGATAAGLSVDMADGAQPVLVLDLVVDGGAAAAGAGVGVLLRNGDLTLSAPTVKRAASHGVIADPRVGGEVRLTVDGGQIHANRGTGLFIRGAKRLNLVGLRVCENLGSQQVVGGSVRVVGGAFVAGTAPPQGDQKFQALRIHRNSGDQMAIGVGPATWVLDGPSDPFCGGGRNEFAEYVTGLGIATGAPALARNNGWKNDPPKLEDAAAFGGLGTVTTGAELGSTLYCPAASDLACPAP